VFVAESDEKNVTSAGEALGWSMIRHFVSRVPKRCSPELGDRSRSYRTLRWIVDEMEGLPSTARKSLGQMRGIRAAHALTKRRPHWTPRASPSCFATARYQRCDSCLVSCRDHSGASCFVYGIFLVQLGHLLT